MQQYLVDKWTMPAQSDTPTGAQNAKPICREGITTDSSCVNLDVLVPDFLVHLPVDEEEQNAHHTGYAVYKDDIGRHPLTM